MHDTENKRALQVFVLHWNRPDECIQAVEGLLAQDYPVEATIIDNASEESSLRSLAERLPSGVRIQRLTANIGWGPALNAALREWLSNSKGEYCVVSAHDALPGPHCLRLLAQSMDQDPRIGIACPEYGVAEVPCYSRLRYIQSKPVKRGSVGAAELVDLPHGTLMLLRRACLEEIGIFDERYFAYGDEHELGLRAARHHWKVMMIWGAVVVNPGTWTASSTRSYLFARNSLLLIRTYSGWWSAATRCLLMIPNTLRLLLFPPEESYAFSARARFAAMRDFLMGHYGPPPRFQ